MAITACNYGAHDFVHMPESPWTLPERANVEHVHVCANCNATYIEQRPGPCYACRPLEEDVQEICAFALGHGRYCKRPAGHEATDGRLPRHSMEE